MLEDVTLGELMTKYRTAHAEYHSLREQELALKNQLDDVLCKIENKQDEMNDASSALLKHVTKTLFI